MRILLRPQHWPRGTRIILLQSKRCASIARRFAPTSIVCVENGVNNAKLTAGIARGVGAKRLSRFMASRRILLETAVGRDRGAHPDGTAGVAHAAGIPHRAQGFIG